MMVAAEHRQLMPPRIPAFGKTMNQNYEVVAGAAFGIMQAHVANICETVFDSELALRLQVDSFENELESRSQTVMVAVILTYSGLHQKHGGIRKGEDHLVFCS